MRLQRLVPGALGLFANYHGGKSSPAAPTRAGSAPGTGPVPAGAGRRRHRAAGGERLAYFRGRPAIRAIDVRFINSDQTRELAFTAGELDLIVGRREQRWVERMRAQPNTVVDVFGPASSAPC